MYKLGNRSFTGNEINHVDNLSHALYCWFCRSHFPAARNQVPGGQKHATPASLHDETLVCSGSNCSSVSSYQSHADDRWRQQQPSMPQRIRDPPRSKCIPTQQSAARQRGYVHVRINTIFIRIGLCIFIPGAAPNPVRQTRPKPFHFSRSAIATITLPSR